MIRWAISLSVVSLFFVIAGQSSTRSAAQSNPQASVLRINANSGDDLRVWDDYVDARSRSGALRVRTSRTDPDLPFRQIERLDQFHRGVKIWGGDVVRNSERGAAVSIYGALAPDLDLAATPTVSANDAVSAIRAAGGSDLLTTPELTIVAVPEGGFTLAYTAVIADRNFSRIFVDAQRGHEVFRYSELYRQSVVGTGQGVLGDTKKLSVSQQQGAYVASDSHRPPVLNTYDMGGNLPRAIAVLEGANLSSSDLARDTDNVWSDPAVVDAHAHIAWTYDFFFKRFGRHGLDDHDRPVTALVNPVSQQDALRLSGDDINFAVNAFWCPICGPRNTGVMMFGNGIPANISLGGRSFTYLAGALDVVAHELTHAVTTSSSNLLPSNEAGALNEAFSDMMGTSAEFYFRDQNATRQPADYTIGEDVIRGARAGVPDGIRSMSNPAAFGDADHYRNKYVGADDSGGLHTNTGIPNQAFYLAIEGGTNRTSGINVPGVGAANREQIEKAFFRAFTLLLPANATFVTARSATTQAARDLYGAGSRAEQMIDLAWTAVGVPDPARVSIINSSVAARTQISFAFTMTTAGTYQINLRGNDPSLDLDLYLSPNSTLCSRSPLQPACKIAVSITPEAVESVRWPVRIGESYRIWVDNLGPRSSTFTIEHVVTP